MASPQVTQENRFLEVETPLGKDVLVINGFSGTEGVSGLFHWKLDLLAEVGRQVSFDKLLGQKITVSITLDGGKKRYLNGVMGRISQGSKHLRFVHYQADVYPWLWLLTHKSGCRIFQEKTVPEILKQIFDEARKVYPGVSYRDATAGSHSKLDYCVQYRETDFNFVSRLMEQEGIFYFFEHEQTKHTLVFADANSAFKNCPEKSSFHYQPEGGYAEREDVVLEWSMDQQLRPGKYVLRDHHFELPGKTLEVNEPSNIRVGNNDKLEVYDYPGEYAQRFGNAESGKVEPEGRKLVRARMEEEELPAIVYHGTSDSRYFISGYKFTLSKHFACDGEYIITSLNYSATQTPDYISNREHGTPYQSSFTCAASSRTVRPLRTTPKPFVQGPQTAVVVGKSGEEIWVDKYGRVKVQFFWDRDGKKDEKSSCWVRVSQPWAAGGWGGMWIPRIGQEVIVNFLEGDPDRPIITGRVYNSSQMPPYELPDHQTRSCLKSHSSKGGGSSNFNELRFEDKKGQEQVFLHAEKDEDERVKNDSREWIGNDRHLIVKNDQKERVEHDKHGFVEHNQSEYIGGKMSVRVGMDSHHDVGTVHVLHSGQEIHLTAGMKVIIDAGMEVCLQGAGGFIDIGPAGITIQGTMVNINSGGAAGTGTSCNPDDPQKPDEADDSTKGTKM